MINISFDNPYLLLIAIPLLLAVAIPAAITLRKQNIDGHAIASICLHVLLAACITFAVAGTMATTVKHKTQVVVLADVSYSANRNLDKVDEYVGRVREELPLNSELGVICFGRDCKLVTPFGGRFQTVQNSGVDDSATDLTAALNYAKKLYLADTVKYAVIISDGRISDEEGTGELARTVSALKEEGVAVKAMYLDDNLKEDEPEAQIASAEYTSSTYQGAENILEVYVECNAETPAVLTLKNGETELARIAKFLVKGTNVFEFELLSSTPGTFEYTLSLAADEDTSSYNNEYRLTQTVAGKLKVLFVGADETDKAAAEELYGEKAEIDFYLGDPDVPYTVEDICLYDEIVLSNVDVRNLHNRTAFITAVDRAVSQFGKSLLTFGDVKIQNKEDETLQALGDALPVRFGNDDRDPKLYAIVLDTSRSMESASRLLMAKRVAKNLVDLLSNEDWLMLVSFSGDATVAVPPVAMKRTDREALKAQIDSIQASQGTFLGLGLKTAYDMLVRQSAFVKKQIMLISDGMPYDTEQYKPTEIARSCAAAGIVISAVNPENYDEKGISVLQSVANFGKGEYFFVTESTVDEVVFSEIADDVTESVIEENSLINIEKKRDGVMSGVSSLPYLSGYVYATAKASATTVLTVDYRKESGSSIKVPVYAYWKYGNGRVASFTSTLSGKWVSAWEDDRASERFFQNILTENTPKERIDYPFTLDMNFDGTYGTITLTPARLVAEAEAKAEILLPNGETVSAEMTFSSTEYLLKFVADRAGKYTLNFTYSYGGRSYGATVYYDLSYLPEYDCFAGFSPTPLVRALREEGAVTTDGTVSLDGGTENETRTVDLTAALLIAAVVIYVVDIGIRKLRWADIKGLFVRSKEGKR